MRRFRARMRAVGLGPRIIHLPPREVLPPPPRAIVGPFLFPCTPDTSVIPEAVPMPGLPRRRILRGQLPTVLTLALGIAGCGNEQTPPNPASVVATGTQASAVGPSGSVTLPLNDPFNLQATVPTRGEATPTTISWTATVRGSGVAQRDPGVGDRCPPGGPPCYYYDAWATVSVDWIPADLILQASQYVVVKPVSVTSGRGGIRPPCGW